MMKKRDRQLPRQARSFIYHGLLNPIGAGGGGGQGLSAYASEVLSDGPTFYYRLNETTGTAVVDAATNGNDSTYENSPLLGQTSLVPANTDGAVDFNGTDERILVSPSFFSSHTEGSIEFWINGDDLETDAFAQSPIIALLQTDSQNSNNSLYFRNGKTRYEFRNNTGSGGTDYYQSDANFTFSNTTTYHIVVVSNPSGSPTFYVNGVDVGATTVFGTPSGKWWNDLTTFNAAYIARFQKSDVDRHLNGTLDDFSLYDKRLAAADVLRHYQSGTG